jgi:hypothetical protein
MGRAFLLLALLAPASAPPGDDADALRARVRVFDSEPRPVKGIGDPTIDLGARVKKILEGPRADGWRPTGIDRRFYLDVSERIVREAAGWVDDQGRLIDPVLRKEVAQSTPRFVSSAALLLAFGRAPEAKEAAVRAMSSCCRRLADPAVRSMSPDFWMRELATAYVAFETVADADRRREWAGDLGRVQPEKIYLQVRPDGSKLETLHNWTVYAAAGEVLREAAGIKASGEFLWGRAFFDKYMPAQLGHFTSLGMYRDPGDPITYDVTTRLQFATALALGGYDGDQRDAIGELLRRGGLATLLFVSPQGFVPYGGRSSQFCFQEAIVSALCELEARRYRKADPALAGAFKRQARLSALSMKRWVVEMTPWRHLKNGFPPEARHGLDTYGEYSVYSLLISSFLGLAALYADDTIEEAPCPSERGGFVFELSPAFHKIFANCGRTYVEIDTDADPHYDATGLGRFTRDGVPLELGLGMPFATAAKKGQGTYLSMAPGVEPPKIPVAIGPALKKDGAWVSLAERGGSTSLKTIQETADAVAFTTTTGAWRNTYRLREGELVLQCEAVGKAPEAVRMIVPLRVTDGLEASTIEPGKGEVRVLLRGASYLVRFDPGLAATIDDATYANRNGVYRSLVLEGPGPSIEATLRLEPPGK